MTHSSTSALAVVIILNVSLLVTCKPNFVLFVGDDLGFGDLSSYGHPTQEWGAIDKLGAEGIRLTQCYSSATFCTPSRASFLTGRLPLRTGLVGLDDPVLFPHNPTGLPHWEITLAEGLREAGYTTGIVGKWHLGINSHNHEDGTFLPHSQGFDFVGTFLPFTLAWACDTDKRHLRRPRRDACFLYKNRTITEQPIILDHLTEKLVHDAKSFLFEAQRTEEPFFLYFPFPQTHTPMFNKKQFKNKSKRGIYGDQVNEMAWAVGEVMSTLNELGLDNNTLTMFISDHGPHREIAEEGGSSGIFRGGKGYFTEGAFRVPAMARWPGVIAQGQVSSEVVSLMDIFPTFLSMASASLPEDRHLDGQDISNILLFNTKVTEKRVLYFYCSHTLMAVRYGAYKIYFYEIPFPEPDALRQLAYGTFPLHNVIPESCRLPDLVKFDKPVIYNVEIDPGELYPLPLRDHVALLHEVQSHIVNHKRTLNDIPEYLITRNDATSKVIPCCNYPYCMCSK